MFVIKVTASPGKEMIVLTLKDIVNLVMSSCSKAH